MIVLIGTGIAALGAIAELAAQGMSKREIMLLEKSRGLGGRIASRWIGAEKEPTPLSKRFDHGAPYLKLGSGALRQFLEREAVFRTVAAVSQPIVGIDEHGQLDLNRLRDANDYFYLPEGNNAFFKPLLSGYEVRYDFKAVSIDYDGKIFFISDGSQQIQATQIILTAPAPQSSELLKKTGSAVERTVSDLSRITYRESLILLCAIRRDRVAALPEFFAAESSADISSIAGIEWLGRDRFKRPARAAAYPDEEPLTVRMSASFSARFYNADEAETIEQIRQHLDRCFGVTTEFLYASLKKWRYAFCNNPNAALAQPETALRLAGDFISGSEIAEAFESGVSAAKSLSERQFPSRERE